LSRLHPALPVLASLLAALVTSPAQAAAPGSPEGAATSAVSLTRTTGGDTARYTIPFDQIVTAARMQIPLRQSPAATSVVGHDQLLRMPRAIAADEALRTVPGVRMDNQANGERLHLSIRGQGILTETGIRGIRVLLDGLPLNDPTGVAPDLYDVDWSQVSQVEVLRGPTGALYGGGGGSGGAVNITTADGAPGAFGGRVEGWGGSHGFWKSHLLAGGTRDQVNYSLSLSRTGGEGYRVHTAFAGNNGSEKVHWTPSSSVRVTEELSWTDYFNENPEGLNLQQAQQDPRQPNPDALTYNELYDTHRLGAGTTVQVDLTPDQQLEASAWLRTTRYREAVPSSVLHRALQTPGFTAQYHLHSRFGEWHNHFSVGSDLQWQSVDEYRLKNLGYAREDTLLSNQSIAQRGLGFFALDRIELGSRWGLLVGVRYDDMHNRLTDRMAGDPVDLSGAADFHRGTARAGLSYLWRPEASFYANWGQGFLPPTTNELASNPDYLGGFNMGLVPATSQSVEAGARGGLSSWFSYDLALFRLTTDHDFDRYRITDRPLETFYRNLGFSRRYGLETLVRCRPVQAVSAEVAYTYSDFNYTDPASIRDNWLPNSPRHQLDADLEVRALPGLTFGISVDAQSRWAIDSQNSAFANGFTLWGARAAYAFELRGVNCELSVSGRNLFDADYMAFTEPDPDGNSYQPGPKREVFGGLKVEF